MSPATPTVRGAPATAYRLVTVILACLAVCLIIASAAQANETVISCGAYPNHVFAASSAYGMATSAQCPGGGLSLLADGSYGRGQGAIWQANAPAGLVIVGASTAGVSTDQGAGQFGADFYWNGGKSNLPAFGQALGFGYGPFASPDFGWLLVCATNSCVGGANGGGIVVSQVSLYVQETTGPTFDAPYGLWQTTGWVRGTWPFFTWGNSPSGLCSLSATLNGDLIDQTTSGQDVSQWHQCGAPPISQAVDTTRFGQGALALTLSTSDAAGVPASLSKNVYVDNQQPTVSLSGPTDAPSTAGTQYVTATATAGPSGVDGIACSVDHAPAHWYPAATAQVPVSGVGEHSVSCAAANNAVDASGARAWSPSAATSIKIGDPTVSGISFFKVANALRCRRVKHAVRVRARWVTVHRHHRRVRVRRHAHTRLVKGVRCHPRTELKRVKVHVRVRRHGRRVAVTRTRRERVVLTPRLVGASRRRIGHGEPTTVSGWLGNYAGVALGGQTVDVLTAPDNGLGQFTTAAVTTTAANGGWTAVLPAGPSRLIEAAYGGSPTTEASVSGQVHLTVPARIKLLEITPRRVAWGHGIRLVGQLDGGYLPGGGEKVRLRIGEGTAVTTYGVHVHVHGRGRFGTSYTFGAGEPAIHRSFWFEVATLPQGDYPYAPANSRRLVVRVGGHPKPVLPPKSRRHLKT